MTIGLAIKYGHNDVMRFLVQTNQINSDISRAIGEFATPKTFDSIMQSLHLPSVNGSHSVPDACGHLTLREWYQSLSAICVPTVYSYFSNIKGLLKSMIDLVRKEIVIPEYYYFKLCKR